MTTRWGIFKAYMSQMTPTKDRRKNGDFKTNICLEE